MNILGVIVEYNPLHSGHLSHLSLSKEISGCDAIIAVMSGNFVQRGEPAIYDKWKRTKMALEAGVDLVIELPLYYACAGAEYFAKAAVTLLEKTGIVNSLCFGSEWADIDLLKECAQAILKEDSAFKDCFKKNLQKGLSYPAARAQAASVKMPDTPNNILGIEYLKALMAMDSAIKPLTVPRSPGSASEVRASLRQQALENLADYDNLSPIFHYILRSRPAKELQNFVDVSEGLENRFIDCAKENRLISDIIKAAKCKRYTHLRLQRAVLHIILGISKENLQAYKSPQYIRVLGFNRKRADLLSLLEKNAALPLVTNLSKAKLPSLAMQMLEEEIYSTKIYSLAFKEHVYLNEYSMPIKD